MKIWGSRREVQNRATHESGEMKIVLIFAICNPYPKNKGDTLYTYSRYEHSSQLDLYSIIRLIDAQISKVNLKFTGR